MKKLSLILALVVMSFVYAPGVFAGNHHRSYNVQRDYNCDKKTTGVPLDGGLLALLAGAGITYFSARKKKKNEQ